MLRTSSQDASNSAPAEALYVLFIGGNDVADAVRALPCVPTGATGVQVIMTLYEAGARNFLIINSPVIGLTPSFYPSLNIPAASGYAACFSLLYNFGGLHGFTTGQSGSDQTVPAFLRNDDKPGTPVQGSPSASRRMAATVSPAQPPGASTRTAGRSPRQESQARGTRR